MTTVLEEPFNDLTAWTLAGTSPNNPQIVTGRTGTGLQYGAGSTSTVRYSIVVGSQTAVLTLGFAVRFNASSVSGSFFQCLSDSAATIHNSILLNSDGSLAIERGTISQIGISAAGIIAANTWYYLELQITLGDSPSGSFTLRVDGTTVASGTSLDTKNAGTKTVYDAVRFIGVAGATIFADDFYLLSGTGESFRGDIHLGGATAKTWDGSVFVAAPIRTWNGTTFVDAVAVKTWNGSAFV